ncbi:pantoate--beta-alanine ligase [Reichenbachiella carrageenanivorans]|uniref:Pantothenate synthetase n=1 Tax=Reichenbachiella carrageenanivorans TaxID=2979869 RepID=A0ABY6D3L1_9BACT|nr:pantoate--beta-alanine ligase [Reichenbachiella carrageenanivorans]UXX80751.1 pantoate--beta-alanine ligase [Reichenbachiella carrageenanivorans]
MKIVESIVELQAYLDLQRLKGKAVGLVPTMGALHQGHLELIHASVHACDLTVCSIFVNPTQFNNPDDLLKYPKQLETDQQLLSKAGCDVVFVPTVAEMYPDQTESLSMSFGVLEHVLEGEFRPGHFSGVGVVVSKLLNIVQPQVAFFGQKDLQQLAVIRKMVRDLNIRTKIVAVPTVREPSGLAMSSRNLRLSEIEKEIAAHLYKTMQGLKDRVCFGDNVPVAIAQSKDLLAQVDGLQLEYLEVVDSATMQVVSDLSAADSISICAAAHVGEVRIIDNMYIKQTD